MVGVDQAAALSGVLVREQPLQGHAGEERIAVVALAIGEGQLGRLGDSVDVGDGVVAQRGEVEPFQQAELLQEDGSLAPGAAGEQPDVAERALDRTNRAP